MKRTRMRVLEKRTKEKGNNYKDKNKSKDDRTRTEITQYHHQQQRQQQHTESGKKQISSPDKGCGAYHHWWRGRVLPNTTFFHVTSICRVGARPVHSFTCFLFLQYLAVSMMRSRSKRNGCPRGRQGSRVEI